MSVWEPEDPDLTKYRVYWLGNQAPSCDLTAAELQQLESALERLIGRPRLFRATRVARGVFDQLLAEALARAFVLEPKLAGRVSERAHAEACELADSCDLGWWGERLWSFLAGSEETESIEAGRLISGLARVACGPEWEQFEEHLVAEPGPGRQAIHALVGEAACWSLEHQAAVATGEDLLERISVSLLGARQFYGAGCPATDSTAVVQLHRIMQTLAGRACTPPPEWPYEPPEQSCEPVSSESQPIETAAAKSVVTAVPGQQINAFVPAPGWALGWCKSQRPSNVQPPAPPDASFGVLCDVRHSGSLGVQRVDLSSVVEAWNDVRDRHFQFCVMLGDMIMPGQLAQLTTKLSQVRALRQVLAELDHCVHKAAPTANRPECRLQVHHVAGGLEATALPREEVTAIRGWQSEEARDWPDSWRLTGGQVRYYSLQPSPSWRVIALDSHDICMQGRPELHPVVEESKAQISKPASECRASSGAVGAIQLHWLADELKQAKKLGQKVAILCHCPLEPRLATELTWNHDRVLECLHQSDTVVAVLSANEHGLDQASSVLDEQGIHHVSLATSALYPMDHAHFTVALHKDAIKIKGGNVMTSFDLPF